MMLSSLVLNSGFWLLAMAQGRGIIPLEIKTLANSILSLGLAYRYVPGRQ